VKLVDDLAGERRQCKLSRWHCSHVRRRQGDWDSITRTGARAPGVERIESLAGQRPKTQSRPDTAIILHRTHSIRGVVLSDPLHAIAE